MPKDVNVFWVDDEKGVKKLQGLTKDESEFIGVDSEWKPVFLKNQGPPRISILQVSGEKQTFVIDMIALKDSKKLDKVLTDVFQQKTIVGFSF